MADDRRDGPTDITQGLADALLEMLGGRSLQVAKMAVAHLGKLCDEENLCAGCQAGLREELDRLRPVVRAAEAWRNGDWDGYRDPGQVLAAAVDAAQGRVPPHKARPGAVVVAARSDAEVLRENAEWIGNGGVHCGMKTTRAVAALSRATILDRAELVAWLRETFMPDLNGTLWVRKGADPERMPPALRALLGGDDG